MVMKKTNRSVLLVEDHKELAETVGEYLEASDYIVDYAADGLTALHLGATNTYGDHPRYHASRCRRTNRLSETS